MFLSDFFFFLPIHRDSAHFALLSYEHCHKPGGAFCGAKSLAVKLLLIDQIPDIILGFLHTL